MPTLRDQIIICHGRGPVDETWRGRLRNHLRPFERRYGWSVWDFSSIRPGENYDDEIVAAFERARLAILLVTPDLLASDLLIDTALPALLEVAEKKGVRIFWIAVCPSGVKDSLLWRYPPIHDPEKPLSGLSRSAADAAIVRVCEEIARQYRTDGAEPSSDADAPSPSDPEIGGSKNVSFLRRYSQNPRSSRFATIVTSLGLAMLPIAAFGASGTAQNYHKLFMSIGAMGGFYILFGLFFANITMFPSQHRMRALGLLLGAFILLTLILGARAAGYYYEGREKQRSAARIANIVIPKLTESTNEPSPDLLRADLEASELPDLATVDLHKSNINSQLIIENAPQKKQAIPKRNCRDATQDEVDAQRKKIIKELEQERYPGDSLPGETDEEKAKRLAQKIKERIPPDDVIATNIRAELCGAPYVIPGTAEVRGSLDHDMLSKISRLHSQEIRHCYQFERFRKADLKGRVMVQFTISPTGQVAAIIVQSSTLGSPPVEQCIASKVRTWQFPKPQGGIIVAALTFNIPLAEDQKQEEKQENMRNVAVNIKKHQKELNWCIRENRKHDPSLTSGIVKLYFTITLEGNVADARIESSTLNSTKADDCILRQVNQWIFSKSSPTPIEIRYPIKLDL